ncbi:MAG TPA: tRNA uracil 4-sulfurtransferase ThiI [Longimicrobiales bacterium]|nr:tRNA uracil 4-sulfurtransferase ThiI [Longimicrobiales bacterium]
MSEPATDQRYFLRLAGEFSIKSRRTQQRFRKQLLRNVGDALESAGGRFDIEDRWSRIHVRADSSDAASHLARVFGIGSLSRIDRTVPAELDEIVRAGSELYADVVRGRTFAVRARRSGTHAFRSKEIEIALGAELDAHAKVDLSNPDVTVGVEVRDELAHFFSSRVAGAGGLPLGVEGRALALVSGGYDSAVAAWLMLKRGVDLDYVFCNLGGDAYERSVLAVMKVLADRWSYGSQPRIHVVPFEAVVDHLRERTVEKYWQVLLKRAMYRTASGLAAGHEALVTGEAVGQVSSQTLPNLRAIEPAAALPVFRPLIGFDKDEIIARARTIGTADLSARVKEYCAIAPGRPVTAATVEAVDGQEARMDPAVLEAALAEVRTLGLRDLTATDLVAPYLFTADVPAGATVLDCRSESDFARWHLDGARLVDDWELERGLGELDRDATYVLYCEQGVRTAQIAERMQRAGFEAYSFRGGAPALRRWVEAGTAPAP